MTAVVIMAGGRGMRLHPLTDSRPKPMFNVGGKPILEQIIEGFAHQGFKEFWLCVNYRAELIEAYFGYGERRGLSIRYIHETEPLGTAGALRLLGATDSPFIVQNGDVLAKLDYAALLNKHAAAGAQATVCVALYQHQVPYGVATFEGEKFTGLREKPIENIPVNAGIYALDPAATLLLPEGPSDMPDLIARCNPVEFFPIEEYWADLGSFVDLAKANNEWRT